MKRSGVMIAVTLVMSLALGCESGREEGIPSGPLQGTQTNEFREAMQKAGNKMMKGQMGKKAAAPITKSPEQEPKEEKDKEKPSTP